MNRRSFLVATAAAVALGLQAAQGSPATINTAGAVKRSRRMVRAVDFHYDDGQWRRGTWAALKQGMLFRLIESDENGNERIVDQGTKYEVCVAVSDAFREPAPVYWGVKCEPFPSEMLHV